jgi:hypothetical protein
MRQTYLFPPRLRGVSRWTDERVKGGTYLVPRETRRSLLITASTSASSNVNARMPPYPFLRYLLFRILSVLDGMPVRPVIRPLDQP